MRERGERVGAVPGPIEHEAERRPCLAIRGVEPAGLAGVLGRDGERGSVGHEFGTRHLELHDTGVGKPDVSRGLRGHLFDHASEYLARVHDL